MASLIGLRSVKTFLECGSGAGSRGRCCGSFLVASEPGSLPPGLRFCNATIRLKEDYLTEGMYNCGWNELVLERTNVMWLGSKTSG